MDSDICYSEITKQVGVVVNCVQEVLILIHWTPGTLTEIFYSFPQSLPPPPLKEKRRELKGWISSWP